jgi:uncharacterized coiled-coil protein SlyX
MVALFLALAISNPSPSPAPHLRTIITVKSSPFCGAFAAHVNSAIGSAVENDQTLGSTIVDLRSGDLNGGPMKRANQIQRLENLSDAIYKQYRSGESEIKQLRDLAAKTTDPTEKADVSAAADALGGALYRQHLVQRDLDGFLAFLNASDMAGNHNGEDFATADPGVSVASAVKQDPPGVGPASYWVPQGYMRASGVLAGQESSQDDARMAQAAADDFQRRLPAILQDEMNAGDHIATAGDNCD